MHRIGLQTDRRRISLENVLSRPPDLPGLFAQPLSEPFFLSGACLTTFMELPVQNEFGISVKTSTGLKRYSGELSVSFVILRISVFVWYR
jgi:hypothetical protein